MNTDNLVELEEFFADIEPELPRCPTPVIENRIRDAIIESCERANIWRWHHPEILLVEGLRHYQLLTPTSDMLIHSVLSVTKNGRPIDCANSVDTHEGTPSRNGFVIGERGLLELTSTPTVSSTPLSESVRPEKGIELVVSIKPSRKTLEVSEVLYRDYYQLIVTGTLARAFMMTQRPWTNIEMGQQKGREYELLIGKARQAVDRGFTTGSQRFKPRKFTA